MYRTEIKSKTSFTWVRYFKYANWKYLYSYTNLIRSFAFSSYLYWNLGNRLIIMCSPPNDKNKFHTRGHNIQENVSYVLDFYVSTDVHFRILIRWKKQIFHISPLVFRFSVSILWSCFLHFKISFPLMRAYPIIISINMRISNSNFQETSVLYLFLMCLLVFIFCILASWICGFFPSLRFAIASIY